MRIPWLNQHGHHKSIILERAQFCKGRPICWMFFDASLKRNLAGSGYLRATLEPEL
jgi:hypothetical protein